MAHDGPSPLGDLVSEIRDQRRRRNAWAVGWVRFSFGLLWVAVEVYFGIIRDSAMVRAFLPLVLVFAAAGTLSATRWTSPRVFAPGVPEPVRSTG